MNVTHFNNLNKCAANTKRLQKMLAKGYMNNGSGKDAKSNFKHRRKAERQK